MRTKIINPSIILIAICYVLSLAGCASGSANQKLAEDFVKKVLTAPDESISEIVNSDLAATDIEQYNEKMTEAVSALCGDFVSKETLTDVGSALFQNIMAYHAMAAQRQNTDVVKNVEIIRVEDRHYRYEAGIATGKEDEVQVVTGNLQFDEENLIDYMTIDGF